VSPKPVILESRTLLPAILGGYRAGGAPVETSPPPSVCWFRAPWAGQRVPTRVGRWRWRCDSGDSVRSPLRFTSIDEVKASLKALSRDPHWGWRRNRREWVAGARRRAATLAGQKKLPWDPTL